MRLVSSGSLDAINSLFIVLSRYPACIAAEKLLGKVRDRKDIFANESVVRATRAVCLKSVTRILVGHLNVPSENARWSSIFSIGKYLSQQKLIRLTVPHQLHPHIICSLCYWALNGSRIHFLPSTLDTDGFAMSHLGAHPTQASYARARGTMIDRQDQRCGLWAFASSSRLLPACVTRIGCAAGYHRLTTCT